MKIGISTSVIQRGRGGVGQYLFALLRGLSAVAREHQFVLFVLEEDLPLFEFLDGSFERVTVPEKYRAPIPNILWHQRQLPRLCREHTLDVIHVPSYRRLPWAANCPRVGTIHDLAPFRLSGKYDFARMFYGRVIVKQLARRQDRIIAVSQATADDISRWFGVPRAKLHVIHNGLEHSRFFPREKPAARQFASRELGLDQPFLLYVARLEHPGKNHVRLIEAFEEFKSRTNTPFELVFGGSDWHGAETIHQRAAASPCRDQIRFLGFVPDEQLPLLYAAAELFIYPSLFEGFGMPPVEAMACGCPVVCSDRGSLGEVVSSAALIVNPENAGAMADALTKVTSNPQERERLVRAGLARAADFNWEKTARETLQVYQEAIQQKSRRSAIQPPAIESVASHP